MDRGAGQAAGRRPRACCCRRRAGGGCRESTGRPAWWSPRRAVPGTSSGSVRPSCTPGSRILARSSLREAEQRQVEVHVLEGRQFDRQQVVVPVGQVGRLVVGDAVGLDLRGRQVRGHVDRHLLQPELLRGLVACVAADDHAVGIDDNRLAEAELLDRSCHGVHGSVILAGIAQVGFDVREIPEINFHRRHLEHRKMCRWLRDTECGPGNPGRRAGGPEKPTCH